MARTVRNKSNPNGANQYLIDPRQKTCWEFYINPKSETFANACQSAIRAGYTDTTALHITTEQWFIEKLRRLNLLSKGEKVLDETLEYNVRDEEGKIDAGLARVKLEAAKHVTSTLGKNDGYSTRNELTGADGKELPTPIYGGSSTKPDTI